MSESIGSSHSKDKTLTLHASSSSPRVIFFVKNFFEDGLYSDFSGYQDLAMEGNGAKNLLTTRLTAKDPMLEESLNLHKISKGDWTSFNKVVSDTVYFWRWKRPYWKREFNTRAWTNFRMMIVRKSSEEKERYYLYSDSRSKEPDEDENKDILDILARDIEECKLSGRKTSLAFTGKYHLPKCGFGYEKREFSFRTELRLSERKSKWIMVIQLKSEISTSMKEGTLPDETAVGSSRRRRTQDPYAEEGRFPDDIAFGSGLDSVDGFMQEGTDEIAVGSAQETQDSFMNYFTFKNGEKLGPWLMQPPSIATLDSTLLNEGWIGKRLVLRKKYARKARKLMSGAPDNGTEASRRLKMVKENTSKGSRLFRIKKEMSLSEIGFVTQSDSSWYFEQDRDLAEAMDSEFEEDLDNDYEPPITPLKPLLEFKKSRVPYYNSEILMETLDQIITTSLMSQMCLDSNVVHSFLNLSLEKREADRFHDILLTQIRAFFFTEYDHSLSDGMLLIVYFFLIKKFMTSASINVNSCPLLCLVDGIKIEASSMMLKRRIDDHHDEEEIIKVYRRFEAVY